MNNNDVLRAIQHILNLSEAGIVDIFKLVDDDIPQATAQKLLENENMPGFLQCADAQLTRFLDGLISYRRGKNEKSPEYTPPPLTNNVKIKKIRIAFDLKEDDLVELLSLADYDVSKSELSSVFRKPGHKHYRECSDDFLMAFITGLTFRTWK